MQQQIAFCFSSFVIILLFERCIRHAVNKEVGHVKIGGLIFFDTACGPYW
jgi:hypothetical protein